jgi:hypothetical protein
MTLAQPSFLQELAGTPAMARKRGRLKGAAIAIRPEITNDKFAAPGLRAVRPA